jgi:dTDP-glucose 4,6-dehydratase
MKKIVYITGCLGFIGSHLTKKCLDMGWFVRGIDRLTYAANLNALENFKQYKNFAFEQKDINDLNFLYDCDYVINTAAETHVDNSIVDNTDFLKSNIGGVHNLLELIKNNRNNKKPIFLHFSTDEVYGDIDFGSHNELSLLKPSNPYSATKAAADMMILAWARTYDIEYVIVRPSNNYGIGQYIEKLIPKTCKYLFLGRKIPLHNNGTPIRTWLHADDTAEACIKIINSGRTNEIYNICGSEEKANIDTIKSIVKEYFGFKDNEYDINNYVDMSYTRKGQDVRYSVEDKKLRQLGWENTKNFDEEIKSIVQYYKDNFIW